MRFVVYHGVHGWRQPVSAYAREETSQPAVQSLRTEKHTVSCLETLSTPLFTSHVDTKYYQLFRIYTVIKYFTET